MGTRKKRPASRVFFFLPAFGRCRPSVSAHPANRIRCSSNIAIADHFPSKTFSFKHHLTGEASLQSNSTSSFKHHLQLLTISLAKPFLSNTTRQARHGQLAEQIYLFNQTPLDRRGMASLQSISTFAFKCSPLDRRVIWPTIAHAHALAMKRRRHLTAWLFTLR